MQKIIMNVSPQTISRKEKASLPNNSDIIAMAWCDKTSFNDIQIMTGLAEKEVIKIMQTNLKPSSFKMWRKRVSGRKKKHSKLLRSEKRQQNVKQALINH